MMMPRAEDFPGVRDYGEGTFAWDDKDKDQALLFFIARCHYLSTLVETLEAKLADRPGS